MASLYTATHDDDISKEDDCTSTHSSEAEQGLLATSSLSASRQHWKSTTHQCFVVANVALFVISIVLFAITFSERNPKSNWLLQQAAYFSPLYSRYTIDFQQKTVAGPLFAESSLSDVDAQLRSYPTASVDAAWERLAAIEAVTISSEDVRKLGKDPSKTVKAPEEWGFGADAHLVQLESQHALHCLDSIRRYAYREHYYPEATPLTSGPPRSPLNDINSAHLSHCLHILLQSLTCNPSMGVITHNWVENQSYPFPDFDINKKCVNHEQMLRWQNANAVTTKQWDQLALRGPGRGEAVFPMPEKFEEWWQSENLKEHPETGL